VYGNLTRAKMPLGLGTDLEIWVRVTVTKMVHEDVGLWSNDGKNECYIVTEEGKRMYERARIGPYSDPLRVLGCQYVASDDVGLCILPFNPAILVQAKGTYRNSHESYVMKLNWWYTFLGYISSAYFFLLIVIGLCMRKSGRDEIKKLVCGMMMWYAIISALLTITVLVCLLAFMPP
jgi:hypothetical protein